MRLLACTPGRGESWALGVRVRVRVRGRGRVKVRVRVRVRVTARVTDLYAGEQR